VVAKVGTLIRTLYLDFGPTLASEYLQERHGLALSKETVRQIAERRGRRPPTAPVTPWVGELDAQQSTPRGKSGLRVRERESAACARDPIASRSRIARRHH